MDSSILAEESLDERVAAMSSSEDGVNALFNEFRSFIISCARKFGGNHGLEGDEVLSSAYIAFYEALGTYDMVKGHFLPYASTVIRCRIVDLARREHRNEAYPLEPAVQDEPGRTESTAATKAAVKVFELNTQHEMLKYEIDSFKKALEDWGIRLEDLLREAPKHRELVRLYRRITAEVLSDKDILSTVLEKKYFPVKKISELTKTPLKKIERARKYIVASILVAVGDYDYLSEYVAGL